MNIRQLKAARLLFVLIFAIWSLSGVHARAEDLSQQDADQLGYYGRITQLASDIPNETAIDATLVEQFDASKLGFGGSVYERRTPDGVTERIVAFGGSSDVQQLLSSIDQKDAASVAKFKAEQYAAALDIVRKYSDQARQTPNSRLTVTGYAEGGALAQYAAAQTGQRAYVFSSMAIDPQSLSSIDAKQLEVASRNITQVAIRESPVFMQSELRSPGGHLGQTISIDPPASLPGILSGDEELRGKVPDQSRWTNASLRHSIEVLDDALALPNSLSRAPTQDVVHQWQSARAPIWWSSPVMLSGGTSMRDQMESMALSASGAGRIVISGRGPDADWLEQRLLADRPRENVSRITEDFSSGAEARNHVAEIKPDLVICVTPNPPEHFDSNERIAAPYQATRDAFDLVHHAYDAYGVWRTLDGKGTVDAGLSQRLESTDTILKRVDLGVAVLSDLDQFAQHRPFVLVRAKTFETIVDQTLDNRADWITGELLKQAGNVGNLGGMGLGTADFAKGGWRALRDGRMTVDSWSYVCDGMVRSTWGGLGSAMAFESGNGTNAAKWATAFGNAGVDSAHLLGKPVEGAWENYYHATNQGEYLAQYTAEVFSNAARGTGSIPSSADWLKSRSLDPSIFSPAVLGKFDEVRGVALQSAAIRFPGRTPVLTMTPPGAGPGASGGSTDTQVVSRMLLRNERIVISDPTHQGTAFIHQMQETLGDGSVRVITQTTSQYREIQIARDYGATRIIEIDPEKRRPPSAFNAPYPMDPPRPTPVVIGQGGDRPNSFAAIPPVHPFSDFAASQQRVGGVMLHGTAQVGGDQSRLVAGDFSLIFNGPDGQVDVRMLRRFVTAGWAVYFGNDGPGISIDPIAPDADKQLVRYIGPVINSDLGRVMRESDYLMKKWAVGTESPGIKGFKNVDTLEATHGAGYIGASRRFWFVPDNFHYRVTNVLLFEGGRMKVLTEYLQGGGDRKVEPADQAFADFFTEHYSEIAEKYPVFTELYDYAQLVGLVRYLKEQGVPMAAFLLANKDMVLTEDSPGTVQALFKKSDFREYVQIWGGVDLGTKEDAGHYVIDMAAATAIRRALDASPSTGMGSFKPIIDDPATPSQQSISVADALPFTTDQMTGVARKASALSITGSSGGLDAIQTDLALRVDQKPIMELLRMHTMNGVGAEEFGPDWCVFRMYRVNPRQEKMIDFHGVSIPQNVELINLLSGSKQMFAFDSEKHAAAGYFPPESQSGEELGLLLMSDGSYTLIDRIGNSFSFAPTGQMTEMQLGDSFDVKYVYGDETLSEKYLGGVPYTLQPGDGRIQVGPVTLPEKMRLIDSKTKAEVVFTVDKDDPRVGYKPPKDSGIPYDFLALMNDGSFSLTGPADHKLEFDPSGAFVSKHSYVLKSLESGAYSIRLNYELDGGHLHVRTADVFHEGLSAALQTIYYAYDNARFRKVILPGGIERFVSPEPVALAK